MEVMSSVSLTFDISRNSRFQLLTVALKHELINEKVKIAAEEEKSENIFNFLSCMLVSKWPSQKPLQH